MSGEVWDGRTEAIEPGELELVENAFEPTLVPGSKDDRRIGRYELIYELGAGGMAGVYLARARGPAGFHKWFAIKRIHPHLAKDRRFVDMFLDEARIAAAVQHPNVAHVFDLGEDHGEYFIAMEYLHGEHLGALSVRAIREHGQLPYAIAGRIVAAAADGLHHAHEARGTSGQPLNLVHRDVSPQNIFITYDGQVKLTDFGIAKAAGRLTHTLTGGMKGKSAYMAPEQALGGQVDRRTDIFALGVVLWEITVGRRLFKAETDAQTLMRITSGRVRAPSTVRPDYPPELERIVMRALAQRPDDRYPSASALARDLDRFVASSGQPCGPTELGGLMQQLFTDRLGAKNRLLTGEPTVSVPSVPRGADATSGSGALPTEASESHVVVRTKTPALRPGRGRRRAAVLALAAVGIAAAAVVATVALTRTPGAVVRIDSAPSGAVVHLDGERVAGTTPLLLEGIAEGRHTLRLELAGHTPRDVTFDAEGDRVDLAYTLLPAPAAPPAPAVAPEPDPAPPPEATPEPEPEPEPVAEADPPPEKRRPRAQRRPAARAAPAYLNLLSRPWGSVTINGRPAGNTPLVRREIPSGTVVIRIRPRGEGPTKTLRIRARPGETISRNVDLE